MTTPIPDLVRRADQGDGLAARELFANLYRELHDLAERHLQQSSRELTLGTTTLLHEAYLRLSEREALDFPDRARFLGYASKAMRGLIIDYARARRAKKRGGDVEITRIGEEDAGAAGSTSPEALTQLSHGLDELAAIDPALAELVDLHFFCGFSFLEIAGLRGVSDRTVQRDWRKARMVLRRLIKEEE